MSYNTIMTMILKESELSIVLQKVSIINRQMETHTDTIVSFGMMLLTQELS